MYLRTKLLFLIILHLTVLVLSKERYKIYLDYSEAFNYKSSIVIADLKTFKLNRTLTALNISIDIKINVTRNDNVMMELTTYEFLSNQYKQFAIHSRRNLCDFLNVEYKYLFYKDMAPLFLPEQCPIKQGLYLVYNYYHAKAASFPNMPFKNVKVEFKIYKEQTLLSILNAYARYDRDVIYREQFS